MRFKLTVLFSYFLVFNFAVKAQEGQIDTLHLSKIRKGTIINISNKNITVEHNYYDHFIFKTPFKFSQTIFIDWYELGTSFTNSIFEQTFKVGADFNCNAYFESDRFLDTVRIGGSFHKNASFNNAKFSKPVLINCDFQQDAKFENTTFADTLKFLEGKASGPISFSGIKLNSGCLFFRFSFEKKSNFSNGVFNGPVNFKETTFYSAADFSNTTINGHLTFENGAFKNLLNLSGIKTTDTTTINFKNIDLPNMINLSEIPNLKTLVDFTHANFNSIKSYDTIRNWRYINLHNSNLSKIKIDYQHFRLCFFSNVSTGQEFPFNFKLAKEQYSGLIFDDKDTLTYNNKALMIVSDESAFRNLFDNKEMQNYLKQIFPSAKLTDPVIKVFLVDCMRKRLFPQTLSTDQIQSIYEQLLKNFKDNGQNESYEALDIEYRDFKNGSFILPHIWNLYGYRREWVFYWALAFLAFFTITTTFFLPILNKPTTEGGVYHMDNLNIDPATERWYNRLWYAFMYTSTLFFILKVDVSKLNFKKKAGVFYIVLIYSLGVLCLGYMANFVLQK